MLEHGWNIIARAHEVANFEIFWNFYIHDADALHSRLIVVERAEVFASDEGITLRVFRSARIEHRANLCVFFLQICRKDFELEILPVSAFWQVNFQSFGFGPPSTWKIKMQCSARRSRKVRTHPYFDYRLFSIRDGDDLFAGFEGD